MSHAADHKTKKRKHAAAAAAAPAADEPSSKRSKTEKGKDKAKDKARRRGTGAAPSQFRVVEAALRLSIPPVFAGNLRAGAEEMLDSMLMRYIPALQGVVLAHHELRFLEPMATIKADCPFANCNVSFQATVWSPYVGQKLVGKVNLCSPDHVSLLVHRTFNVSIPRHHIPTDNWEFEYGPAENDPEFGAEGAEDAEKPEATTESSGRWVHKLTGEKLGGKDGRLEFTVIGLTVANQMLSLLGSIQPDPFSDAHTADHTVQTTTKPKARKAPEPAPAPVPEAEEADSDEEDTFQALGRLGDEAAAREAAQKAEQQAKNERKRKRKEAREAAADAADDGQAEKKKKKKKTS